MGKLSRFKTNAFSFMQKFGQSLLVPIAILPAVGLLYGLGMAMTSQSLLGVAPWLTSGIWPKIAAMFSGVGSIVFGNLALLFAVGIAVGLAKKREGTAGIAAVAGYLRFLYKGIIIKHNKTEPTYTKTSLFLCEKRRFFMARTEKGVVTTI